MEKNRFLDTFNKALTLVILIVPLWSCSFPRFIILRDPLTPEEHINLGMIYEKNKEFDEALKEYSVASKHLPIAYLYMGNLLFQQRDYENAEKNYQKAITYTNDAKAYNNLAWLYYTIDKNLDEALELARKAVELSGGANGFRDTLEKITEKQKSRNQ